AADPVAHWSLLSPASKGHLSKRLTLVGPESTGKSTIAAKLVAAHGGPLVPEYGRAYETFRALGDYRPGELAELARIHTTHQRVLARYSGPIQIEDSDALLTAVWAEMLTGAPDPDVEAIIDPADLYLLLHWDTPWEEDPLRYFSTPRQRQEFFARIEAKLVAHGAQYITLKGDFTAREAAAEAAYAQLLATFRQDPKP
ncbi:MAG: AAA family ATPase, partial [Pseudomonadota bacterium]